MVHTSEDAALDAEADAIRARIFEGEVEAAFDLAETSTRRPGRLLAWSVCAAALAGRSETARDWGAKLTPPEPWAAFAWGCIHHAEGSKKSLARTAWGMRALEGHADMLWLRARVAWRNGRGDEVLELHRAWREALEDPVAAELDLIAAEVLAGQSFDDPETFRRALAMAEDVRVRLPGHERA